MAGNDYPGKYLDLHKMNRILRHRLRNLCAGIKMTVERIADTTAKTHPQIPARCEIIKSELANLQLFTERMDLLFDILKTPEKKSLFELLTALRESFAKAFPLSTLNFSGPELNCSFVHASWIFIALNELLTNAATAAGPNGAVQLVWQRQEDETFLFIAANQGEIPEEIPTAPPEPFNTQQGRHDGIGLAIVFRIVSDINASFSIEKSPDNLIAAKIKLPKEELINE